MPSATTIRTDAVEHARLEAVLPPEVLAEFADLLEQERATLFARAARLGVDLEELQTLTATHGQGETEHTTTGTERAVAQVLEESTLDALEQIAFALARIDDGSYGLCLACGVPIGIDRLRAMPQTARCVTCQSREERSR